MDECVQSPTDGRERIATAAGTFPAYCRVAGRRDAILRASSAEMAECVFSSSIFERPFSHPPRLDCILLYNNIAMAPVQEHVERYLIRNTFRLRFSRAFKTLWFAESVWDPDVRHPQKFSGLDIHIYGER